jgi:outer membrane receptor protein involved in Fe transport
VSAVFAADNARQPFDLPAGDAGEILKRFSHQAHREIVFQVDSMSGITTNAVKGEFTVREALDRMLAGTALRATEDEKTGALAVWRLESRIPRPPSGTPNGSTRESAAKMKKNTSILNVLIGALFITGPASINAQETPPANSQVSVTSEAPVVLNPFEVRSTEMNGYQATTTLDGTRLNTPLADLAASISVETKDFLNDINATDLKSLLTYTMGTEIATVGGNFSGNGGINGLNALTDGSFQNINGATRLRGLAAADLTTDFFATSVGMDSYNTQSVEINRGANSILYGLGSPAGIINTSLIKPEFRDGGNVTFLYGSYGSARGSIDVEKVLIPEKLSVRVAALDDHELFQQKPAYQRSKRYYGVIEYRPFKNTTIRVNAEHVDIMADLPRILPPQDQVSAWFSTAPLVNSTPGPYDNQLENFGSKLIHNPLAGPGVSYLTGSQAIYGPNTQIGWFFTPYPGFGEPAVIFAGPTANSVNPALNPGGIAGYMTSVSNVIDPANPYLATVSPSAYVRQAQGAYTTLAETAFYTQGVLQDTSIFDFRNNLLDGPNASEWQLSDSVNAEITQLFPLPSFLDASAGVDIAWHHERQTSGTWSLLGNAPMIGIDINSVEINGDPNPNFGRPFTATAGGATENQAVETRDQERVTAFLKTDLTNKFGFLGKFLGRQVFTGLLDYSTTNSQSLLTYPYVWGPEVGNVQGNQAGTNVINYLNLESITYLGPSLADRTSAAGADISRIQGQLHFASQYTVNLYNASTGKFENDVVPVETDVPAQENLSRLEIDSDAFTIQDYFWDDMISGIFGKRVDRVKNWVNGPNTLTSDNSALVGPGNVFLASEPNVITTERSRTWSLVAHIPKKFRDKLPLGMDISPFYGVSDNAQLGATSRNVFGDVLPSPTGTTKEKGFDISFLNNRIVLRADWYNTGELNVPNPNFLNIINSYMFFDYIIYMYKDATVASNALNQSNIAQLLNYPDIPPEIQKAWDFTGSGYSRSYQIPPGLTDTSNLQSQGLELEATANITNNWRLTFNVEKETVVPSDTGVAFGQYLAERTPEVEPFYNFSCTPGNSETVGQLLNSVGVIPYETLALNDGHPITNEIRKWRFNIITNYNFDRKSFAKGWSVGGAVRFQSPEAIGYPTMNSSTLGLVPDVTNPYYGPSETLVDAWLGYERRFQNFTWSVKFTVNNLFNNDKLIPVKEDPDQVISVVRIPDERMWNVKTSFAF